MAAFEEEFVPGVQPMVRGDAKMFRHLMFGVLAPSIDHLQVSH
jgi:hypothetical protein